MNQRNYHITFALLMLLSSSLPFLFPATLMVQRAVVVHEMKEKLEREELHEIRVLARSIQWIKYGKECLINNRMFDVKEMAASGDSVVLKGLYDDKEKEIVDRMGSISTPIHQDQERSNTIYQMTHLVLYYTEPTSAAVCEPLKYIFPHCTSSPLCLRFSTPPYSPPERI